MSKIQAVRNMCKRYNMDSNVKRLSSSYGPDIYQNKDGDTIERLSDENCRCYWHKVTMADGRTFETAKIW